MLTVDIISNLEGSHIKTFPISEFRALQHHLFRLFQGLIV